MWWILVIVLDDVVSVNNESGLMYYKYFAKKTFLLSLKNVEKKIMTNLLKNVILNLSLVYFFCGVKPCGSSLDDYRSSTSPGSAIIIIEDAKSMFVFSDASFPLCSVFKFNTKKKSFRILSLSKSSSLLPSCPGWQKGSGSLRQEDSRMWTCQWLSAWMCGRATIPLWRIQLSPRSNGTWTGRLWIDWSTSLTNWLVWEWWSEFDGSSRLRLLWER